MFVADSKAQYCAPPTGFGNSCYSFLTMEILGISSPQPTTDDDTLYIVTVCPGDYQIRGTRINNSGTAIYFSQMHFTQIFGCNGGSSFPLTITEQFDINPPNDTNAIYSNISFTSSGDYFLRLGAYCNPVGEDTLSDSSFVWNMIHIRVLPGPTADAGTDFYACTPQIPPFGPNPGYYWYINLNATDPSPNTGQWTYLSGTPTPAVLIANPNNHQDTAYLQSGIYSYEFLWTVVDSNGCWDADTLKVDHIQSSAVDIYPDTLSVCGPCFKFRPGPSGNYTMPGYDVVPLPSYNSSSDYGYFEFSEIGPMPDTLFHVTYLGGSVVEVCVDSVGIYAVQLEINNVCVHDSDVVVLNFLTTDTIPSLGYFSLGNCAGEDTLFVLIDPPNANQTLNIGTPLPTGVTSVYASAGIDTLFIVMNDLSSDYTINFSYNYNLYGGDTCDQAGVIDINNPQLGSFVAHDFSLLCGTPFIVFMDSLVSGLTGQFTMAPSYQTLQPLAANEFNGAYGHFYPPNPGEYRFTITTHFDCYNQTDTFTVTVSGPPPISDAGTNAVLPCGQSTFQLNGSTPFWGYGIWTAVNSQIGTNEPPELTDDSLINASVNLDPDQNGVLPGIYAFVWTLSPADSTCGDKHYDSVFVYVPNPLTDTSFAGIDTLICDTAGVFLNALANSNLGGHWQSHPDNPPGISFSHPDSNFTFVYGLPPASGEATYLFIWQLNTNCSEPDTVAISYSPQCCFAEYHPAYQHWRNDTLIDQFTVLSGKYYVDGVVTVSAWMDITNVDMIFGECGQLVFSDSAVLKANNSVFRACLPTRSWKGIQFNSAMTESSIIEKSSIKNAEIGIHFLSENDAYLKIIGNDFIDCRVGIKADKFSRLQEAITGNTFTLDSDFDSAFVDVCGENLFESFAGIVINGGQIFANVSQNHFIASNAESNNTENPFYGIIILDGAGDFSLNRFTNTQTAFDAARSVITFTENSIESNAIAQPAEPSIRLNEVFGGFVRRNTLSSHQPIGESGNFGVNSAIFVDACTSPFEIAENKISGYANGIVVFMSDTLSVRENHIDETVGHGIYLENSGYIVTCNEINMKLSRELNNPIGIRVVFTDSARAFFSKKSIMKSNCVFDTRTALLFDGEDAPEGDFVNALTSNNFLYNFWDVGIEARDYYLQTRFNSIISNHHSGTPALAFFANAGASIQSNADYGVLALNAGAITLTNPNQRHSTANCGVQITETGSNVQNDNEIIDQYVGCEDYVGPAGSSNLTGSASAYAMVMEDLSSIHADQAITLMHLLSANKDARQLDDFYASLNLSSFDEFTQVQLSTSYYLGKGDQQAARTALDDFQAKSAYEKDWKAVQRALLSSNSQDELQSIKPMTERGITLRDYQLLASSGETRPATKAVKAYAPMEHSITRHDKMPFLFAYPNPAQNILNIDFTFPQGTEASFMLSDLSGRVMLLQSGQTTQGQKQLNISEIPSGAYILSAWDDQGQTIHQIITKQ
jgi:hypothetical protein